MEMESGKLFIGGISWNTSEDHLREYFQNFGEVVEAVIMKDRTTGRARGFGFVVFANGSVAEKVVRERHIIDGRTVEAKKAVPRDDHQNLNRNNGSIQGSPGPAVRTKKIFVGGLASTVTENDFKTYFDQFGTITDVVVMYDHNTQRPRGFGFITYDSEEAVDKVLFKTFHELHGKMVEVKRAVPKELSPGPTRTQSGSFNYGPNRMSGLLNAYIPGYSSPTMGGYGYGMRMDGRFSPASVDRSGYPPFSPSNHNMGLNLESGFGLNYGDSGLGYGHGTSSYYSGNSSRYGSPIGYDIGSGRSSPMMNATNQNLWGNGSLSYGTNPVTSTAFVGSGTGNGGTTGSFGSIGDIWGSSTILAQGGRENIVQGRGENIFNGRAGYVRNNGGNVGATSPYTVANNVRDGALGNLYGDESFYGNHGWRSSSPDIEGRASFGYGHGAAEDEPPNNYVGGYSINGRSNSGIAT